MYYILYRHELEQRIKNGLEKFPLPVYILIALVMVFIFVQIKTAEPVMPVYLQF